MLDLERKMAFDSVGDARVAFQAIKQDLATRGIVLPPQMQRFLTTREIEQDVLAMDAASGLPGPLSTDPNSAIPWMLTTAIDPEIIRVIFSPLAFAEILGERKAGVWTEQQRMFPIVESTGEVSSYGDFNNNGRAGANYNYPFFQSYLFQSILRYGELEIDRVGLMKINYVSELGLACADLLNRFQNLSYAFGVQNLQNYGILNNPYLSAALTPAVKAWGGTGWFDNGSPAATANEVYNDIIAIITQLVAQTNGALDINSPMTLALSPNSMIAMTFANSFGVFVKALLKEGYPNLKIKQAPQYGTQTANNPQGYSTAGNVVQLIADKIQNQTVAYAAYNEKLRAHKIVPELSAWMQKQTSGTWGTILRSPVAVVTMIGV
jgi:hypothetical protein